MKCLDCLGSPDYPTPPPQFSRTNSTLLHRMAELMLDLHGTKFKKKVNVEMSATLPGVLYGKLNASFYSHMDPETCISISKVK